MNKNEYSLEQRWLSEIFEEQLNFLYAVFMNIGWYDNYVGLGMLSICLLAAIFG